MQAKTNDPRVSAVVLAAGMSTRMGRPKQLLPFEDKTLLGHVLETLHRSLVTEVVVVLGFEAEKIRQDVALGNAKIVINEAFQEGMSTSLRLGLASLDSHAAAALVILADQPFVRAGTVDRLIEDYGRYKPQVVIPTYKGFRGNPVLLDRSLFPEAMNLSGDMGCRAIFGSHASNILKVPVEDVGILLDVDKYEDFENFRQAYTQGQLAIALLDTADLEDRSVGGGPEPSSTQPELVIVGQEAVARVLIRLGKLMRFTVTVVDPLLRIGDLPEVDRVLHVLDFSRLPATPHRYIVVASRGKFDEEALEQALSASPAYVAIVSNKKRVQEMLDSLKTRGMPAEKLANLRAPAGLDIGAESPEEIALSIMAEIVSQRRRRPPSTRPTSVD